MSDLIMSDSVLKKIAGIDGKLAELYQLVDDIKKIKSSINKIFNESENKNIDLLSEYESHFSNANEEFNKLNTDFYKNLKDLENNKNLFSALINQLEQRKNALNEEINLILNTYQNQQEKIDAALVLLNSEKTKNDLLKQQLARAFDGLDNDINHKLEEFKILLQTEINEFQPKTEQKINVVLDEFASNTQKSLTDFNLEKNELFSDITQFKDKIEHDLSQKVDFRLDKIAKDQTDFIERQNLLIQRQNTTIENLILQLKSLERAYEQEKLQNADTIKQIKESFESDKIVNKSAIEAINKTIQEKSEIDKKELNSYVYREAVTNVDRKIESLRKEIEETYKKKGLFS
jgi:hypothetical protein